MSQTRFKPGKKAKENALRMFVHDIEAHPASFADVVRAVGEGAYGNAEMDLARKLAAQSPGDGDRAQLLGAMVGRLRYGLEPSTAKAAWAGMTPSARREAAQHMLQVVEAFRKVHSGEVLSHGVPEHVRAQYVAADYGTKGGKPLFKFTRKKKKTLKPPPDMATVKYGVYKWKDPDSRSRRKV